MESGKEAAANVGASAHAGMEKTRAVVQGQVDKAAAYTTGDKEAAKVNLEAAKAKKQQHVHAAEEDKQRAMRENAAAKEKAAGAAGKEDKQHAMRENAAAKQRAAGKDDDKETETDHHHDDNAAAKEQAAGADGKEDDKETGTGTETEKEDHRDRPAIGSRVEE